ncbi:MAG: adenylate/guanylate cyclase domain-containing protein, partial [Spirulinaceae cyanobacterium]
QQVYGQGFELAKGTEIPITASLSKYLNPDSVLLKHTNTQDVNEGIIVLEDSLLLIASHPIVTSDHEGPIRGSLIMGQYLNPSKIKSLEKQTQLSLNLYSLANPQLASGLKEVVSELRQTEENFPDNLLEAPISVEPFNKKVIFGYALLPDITGKPAILLRVEMPREIYQQGLNSLSYLIISLLLVGIIFGAGTLFLLEKVVLSRLANLSQDVSLIGSSGDLSLRVQTLGKDELTSLAATINSMVQRLEISSKELALEKDKTENLLLNILPEPIAGRLKAQEGTIADNFAEVTVMFADIVGFTTFSEQMPPAKLVRLLNNVFSRFDGLLEKHGLEKIKTIGDCYMVVGGLPIEIPNHAEAIAEMALEMLIEIEKFNLEQGQEFAMRMGINTGSVVAGVIGLKKFVYDLWGDTVNTASRMESHGIPGRIHVSSTTYEHLQHKYEFEARGTINIKGKGEMATFLLIKKKSTV